MKVKHRLDPEGLLVDRVERELRNRIAGMLSAGEKAPFHERRLADEFGVSHKTIRTALARIKQDGLVRSVPGKGTFAVPPSSRKGQTLVLCARLQNPFIAMAVETCMAVLGERSFPPAMTVVCGNTMTEPPPDLPRDDLHAILIVGDVGRPLVKSVIARASAPVVMLGDFRESVRLRPLCDQIVPDTRAGTFLATQHLLAAGHRRILLAGWMNDVVWGREMQAGYRDALETAGIEVDAGLILSLPEVGLEHLPENATHYIVDLGALREQVECLLSAPDAPTALIHNSGIEIQLREMIRVYFHGRFVPDAVLGVNFFESVTGSYRGRGAAWSAAIPFRLLVEQALDLADAARGKPHNPIRIVVDQYRIVHRREQAWQPWNDR